MSMKVSFKPCWAEDDKGRKSLCHDWKTCAGHPYFKISDIQYCRQQIIWLVYNLIGYKSGHYFAVVETWPSEHRDTGYDNTPVQRGFKSEANFASFRRITADIISRLERTGKDGRLLLLEVKCAGDIVEFSPEARSALGYVAGWKQKSLSYAQWKRQRKFRKV